MPPDMMVLPGQDSMVACICIFDSQPRSVHLRTRRERSGRDERGLDKRGEVKNRSTRAPYKFDHLLFLQRLRIHSRCLAASWKTQRRRAARTTRAREVHGHVEYGAGIRELVYKRKDLDDRKLREVDDGDATNFDANKPLFSERAEMAAGPGARPVWLC